MSDDETYDLYGGTPPNVGGDTSYGAAEGIRGDAAALRRRIFEEIQRRGYMGLTCDEAEVVFDMRHQTASARIRELVLKDLAFDSNRRRTTRSGRSAIVWVDLRFAKEMIMATSNQPTSTKTPSPARAPGENDPKLFNVIVVFDVYAVARSGESARECVLNWIRNEQLEPSEQRALEARRDPEVRLAWREEKPMVADDITDEEFDGFVKGNTTIQVFEHLYLKR